MVQPAAVGAVRADARPARRLDPARAPRRGRACRHDLARAVVKALAWDKPGYSAFAQTGLEPLLRARGIRTLLIAGVVSYACVLATAFSAFDSDFDVILVQDAAGSWNPRLGEDTGAIVDLLLGHAIAAEDLQFVPRKVPATDRERSA